MFEKMYKTAGGWTLQNERGQDLPTGLQAITVTVPLAAGNRSYNLSDVLQQGFDADQLVIGFSTVEPITNGVTIEGFDLASSAVFNAAYIDFKINNRSTLDNVSLSQLVRTQNNNNLGLFPLPWSKAGNINWQNSKIRIGGNEAIINNTAIEFIFFALQ